MKETTSLSIPDFSQILQQIDSGSYSPDVIDAITEYDLPNNANLISAKYLTSERSDVLRNEIINYRDSAGRHNNGIEQVVAPVFIDSTHIAGLHIQRNTDGSYAASFIDPLGGEEKTKTSFGKITQQVSDYFFGKAEIFENTAKSYLGPVPHHIVEILEDELNIKPQDIAVTTNKLQHSMRNGYGIRIESDKNSGPIVADILTSVANGSVVVSGTRLTTLEGDIADRSQHSSKTAGEVLRSFHAATLIDIFPKQAAELEAMKLKEAPEKKKRNTRGSDEITNKDANQLSNNEIKDQIDGFSAGRVAELVTKAMALSAILSTTNNQQGNVGSSLVAGGNQFGNQNSNGWMIDGGSLNVESRRLQATDPSSQPTTQPSIQPTSLPSGQPSTKPSGQPSDHPSAQPSTKPTGQPTELPTGQPSTKPSGQPSNLPSGQPSTKPTGQPTDLPTGQPSTKPSGQPSDHPSGQPSYRPSVGTIIMPSVKPSRAPTAPTFRPSSSTPSGQPSDQPTNDPSHQPSAQPSFAPSNPSGQPSSAPSNPTGQPSSAPSHPTNQPTQGPTPDGRIIKGVPDEATYTGAVLLAGIGLIGTIALVNEARKLLPSTSPEHPSASASLRRARLNLEINSGGRH